MIRRCAWADNSDIEREYHDKEWGVAVHDDRLLFEFLILEGTQAGLSWATILRKRENYRKAFDDFHAGKIALYSNDKINALLLDPGIVRNRLKVLAAITNAQHFLAVQEEFGSFDSYIWQFADAGRRVNAWKSASDVPTSTPASIAMSKELKKRGFKFVGATICYALMQAIGMVNDHNIDCFRYDVVQRLGDEA